MEAPGEFNSINQAPKPEQRRSLANTVIPLFATAGILMGNTHLHEAQHDTTSNGQDHVQTLTQAELGKLQRSNLPFQLTVPMIAHGEDNINSGFNTQHLGFDSESIGYAKLPEFKKQIDFISENGQTEVRFGIPRWEVASLTKDKTDIVWNEEQLRYFKEASVYAQSKGLTIFFVTTPPEVPDGFSLDSYKEITKKYYERIANEFTGVTYQLGNEYDAHNVLNYGYYEAEITDEQLATYQEWLEIASSTIHEVNPSAQITQSLTGYPMNQETIEKWKRVHEYIGKYVDVYSLDTYPTSVKNAKELPFLVNQFGEWIKERNQDNDSDIVLIASEVGVPTLDGAYTEEQQAEILTTAITAYKEAGITVIPYQLKDEKSQKKNKTFLEKIEERFGIFRSDGSKKPAADSVIEALKKENP